MTEEELNDLLKFLAIRNPGIEIILEPAKELILQSKFDQNQLAVISLIANAICTSRIGEFELQLRNNLLR